MVLAILISAVVGYGVLRGIAAALGAGEERPS